MDVRFRSVMLVGEESGNMLSVAGVELVVMCVEGMLSAACCGGAFMCGEIGSGWFSHLAAGSVRVF